MRKLFLFAFALKVFRSIDSVVHGENLDGFPNGKIGEVFRQFRQKLPAREHCVIRDRLLRFRKVEDFWRLGSKTAGKNR